MIYEHFQCVPVCFHTDTDCSAFKLEIHIIHLSLCVHEKSSNQSRT